MINFSVKCYQKYDRGGHSGYEFMHVPAKNEADAEQKARQRAIDEMWFVSGLGELVFDAVEIA